MKYRPRNCRPVRRRRAGRLDQTCSWRTPELSSAELDQVRLLQWLSMTAAIFSLTAAAVEFFL